MVDGFVKSVQHKTDRNGKLVSIITLQTGDNKGALKLAEKCGIKIEEKQIDFEFHGGPTNKDE